MLENFWHLCHSYSACRESFVMTHVLLEYHIKVKKFGEAFKAISPIPMHCYNGMLDSDLKESKDKRKLSYIQTKSRDCKHDLQKYSNMKNSIEFFESVIERRTLMSY